MKGILRVLAGTGILALAAVAAQPKANAQAGFYFGYQSPRGSVVVGVPPSPGPGYYWVPGYYVNGYWIAGRWAYSGDAYVPYRYYDDDDGGRWYRRDDDRGYYRRGDDRAWGFRGDHRDWYRHEDHYRDHEDRGRGWGDRRDHDRH